MIQAASCWDVLVLPSGKRCYRMECKGPLSVDTQVHAVMSPDYHNEVALLREQVEAWRARMGSNVPRGERTPVVMTHQRNLVRNALPESEAGVVRHKMKDE